MAEKATIRRGVQAAVKFHSENTGLPYTPFQIKEDNKSYTVRVMQPHTEWVSLFVHRDWASKIGSPRCGSQNDEPDIDECLMCAHGIPRTLRTYIPVRVRGDENQERVQVVEYGRDNLLEVMNQVEELPDDASITDLDYKIKRQGKGTDTKYRWVPAANKRPLNADELALVVPNIDELIVVPSEARMKSIVTKFANTVPDDDTAPQSSAKTPF